jgi:hypothetical protein
LALSDHQGQARALAPSDAPIAALLARAPAVDAAGLTPAWIRLVALLALVASLVGRGLAPALPGSRAGIGSFIALSARASAVLSQLFVLAGAMLAVRLAFATLRERPLGVVYRVAAVPATACIVTLVMASTAQQLEPAITLGLAFVSAVLALAAAPPAFSSPRTRAAGFVLLLAGGAAFAHVIASFLAVRASDRALLPMFTAARAMATLSFGLDVASLVIAGFWAASRRWRRAGIVAALVIGCAGVLAWGATRGARYDASTWQVLASRVLSQLTPHPAPLVPAVLRAAVEVLAPLTALCAILARSRAAAVQGAIALAILARTSTDVPALALVLALAALLAALASVEHREPPAPEPAASPARGDG